jgi:serine phosphatase RsbU (regulator of sigma subunit)
VRRGQTALAIVCFVWMLMDFVYMVVQFPFLNLDIEPMFLRIQPFRSMAIAAVVVSMTILLVRQLRTTNQERAELHGEMASAREIQQYLIPEKLPPTPGLAIQSVYQPSREVGGDFFQVLPDPRDGSTLIVVGDVAGKGLQAGMLAALIVGAIRTAFKFTSDPGSILALLNERLQGRGLVTCLAMRIDRSGSVELANAAHLPPYINGKELALEGALPLGALPDIAFPATRLQLREGESMLLVSDGVVEARNAQGELFGFERTAAISTQSAQNIADAAQRFGQEDDITVLTLTRLASAPAVTTPIAFESSTAPGPGGSGRK